MSGNKTHFLQIEYRPRPKRTHKWDTNVSEKLHKSASSGSKKRQKNNNKIAKKQQKRVKTIAAKMTKKRICLRYFDIFFIYF